MSAKRDTRFRVRTRWFVYLFVPAFTVAVMLWSAWVWWGEDRTLSVVCLFVAGVGLRQLLNRMDDR